VLGYSDRNGFISERLRERASILGIPASHFPWNVPWTAREVAAALRECDNWNQVLLRLGVALGAHNVSKVRSYADRHSLDYSHFTRHRERGGGIPFDAKRDLKYLRTAGNSIATAWFARRGYAVSVPIENRPYDLIVEGDDRLHRIQVKTATARDTSGAVVCRLRRRPSRDGQEVAYDSADVDFFFIIDLEDGYYIVPISDVIGLMQVSLSTLKHRKVPHLLEGAGSIPSSPPSPHSSAAEHQDDNLERHVRLVLRVPGAHRLTDRTAAYEAASGGSSPPGRAHLKLG
jgi:hypothetical protein